MHLPSIFDHVGLKLAAGYLRHAPKQKGRWKLVNHYLPVLREHGPKLGQRTVRVRHGFKFHADLTDWIGQYIYLTGTYEPTTGTVIAALLEEGATMVDVGANVGYFTLLGASRVGAHGRVYAFEPIPNTRKRLLENLALNRTGNVTVMDAALSDEAGELEMYEGPAGHNGLSSLRPLEHSARKIQVQVSRLDDMAQDWPRIDLIKIDVEGAEHKALLGMNALLSRDQPHIVIELTDSFLRQFGHSSNDLTAWLEALGYHAYRIDENALIPFSAPIPGDWPDQFNALFTAGPLPPKLRGSLEVN